LLLLTAVAPALLFVSQRQLTAAQNAQQAHNCTKAIARAGDAIQTLDVRPEPYEVDALCQTRLGRPGLAVAAMRRAVQLDPNNWRSRYTLAAVRGAAGLDPRPDLDEALRLNPYNAEMRQLSASIPKGDSASWDLSLTPSVGADITQP